MGLVIQAEGISKAFKHPKLGKVDALKGASFSAQPGQVSALLGVNGAGKTTMLRILATILQADEGRAVVAGYDVATQPHMVRKSIGFLSNSAALYGRLKPAECLEYFGGFHGLEGQTLKAAVNRAMDRLDIGPFADKVCDQLSTGQKQRVSIARAILHDPPVLFFDEPTNGLDIVTAQTVMEFVEEAREMGKTVVYSTHIMSEVERLCDVISVIHEGCINDSGTLAELLERRAAPSLEKAFLNIVGYQSQEGAA
jgi:sodium transport system ATP-binding protein